MTGATGFIGAKLCKVLVGRGHDIIGTSRNPPVYSEKTAGLQQVAYVVGEALPKCVVSFSPEVLVHLSWRGIPDFSEKTCADNVMTQIQFLGEVEKLTSLRKVVAAGSCSEYGGHRGLCRETDRFPPDSHFAWAKQTLCDYFHLVCRQRNIGLLWLRIFYVYGSGQRPGALIPSLLDALRSGQRPDIRNPHAANDFVYIDDVVDAFVLGIEHEEAVGIANIGSGRLSTVMEASRIVQKLGDKGTNFSADATDGIEEVAMGVAMVADISLADSILSWKPKTSLPEGIARTAELTA